MIHPGSSGRALVLRAVLVLTLTTYGMIIEPQTDSNIPWTVVVGAIVCLSRKEKLDSLGIADPGSEKLAHGRACVRAWGLAPFI